MTKSRTWLVAYDIADHRRLARVHRCLTKELVAVQYSVFMGELDDQRLARIERRLARLIDPRADDVRFYVLTRASRIEVIGAALLPEGVMLPDPRPTD